jgi:hypothetical protein
VRAIIVPTKSLEADPVGIAQDPAVENVVGKIGRADTSTDAAPINMTETIITLKRRDQWPSGTTKEDILQRLDAKLRMPGVTNIWTQPIRNRNRATWTGSASGSKARRIPIPRRPSNTNAGANCGNYTSKIRYAQKRANRGSP